MRIALVAHDNKKADLLDWVSFNQDVLARHDLYATGTTGTLLESELRLDIKAAERPFGWRSTDRSDDFAG
jgi:methylglyoxal synthase